jgi:hypothetical protein
MVTEGKGGESKKDAVHGEHEEPVAREHLKDVRRSYSRCGGY